MSRVGAQQQRDDDAGELIFIAPWSRRQQAFGYQQVVAFDVADPDVDSRAREPGDGRYPGADLAGVGLSAARYCQDQRRRIRGNRQPVRTAVAAAGPRPGGPSGQRANAVGRAPRWGSSPPRWGSCSRRAAGVRRRAAAVARPAGGVRRRAGGVARRAGASSAPRWGSESLSSGSGADRRGSESVRSGGDSPRRGREPPRSGSVSDCGGDP